MGVGYHGHTVWDGLVTVVRILQPVWYSCAQCHAQAHVPPETTALPPAPSEIKSYRSTLTHVAYYGKHPYDGGVNRYTPKQLVMYPYGHGMSLRKALAPD